MTKEMLKDLSNQEEIIREETREEVSDLMNAVEENNVEENNVEKNNTTEINKNVENSKEKIDKSKISVHGFIRAGDIVFPDYSDKASENPGVLFCVDVRHDPTGLGMILVRGDDLHNDSDNPAGKVTVINPNYKKSFGKNKSFTASAGVEISFLDKSSEGNGYTPWVSCSYNGEKGWSFEGAYINPAFRASVTKKLNDALNLTTQGRYDLKSDKPFYGAVIMDINLGKGLGVELRGTRKNGKIIPTSGIFYRF